MPSIEAPRHGTGYVVDGAPPNSPPTASLSLGLESFSEEVMEAFLRGTLYREET
jgi:hypothetical protein